VFVRVSDCGTLLLIAAWALALHQGYVMNGNAMFRRPDFQAMYRDVHSTKLRAPAVTATVKRVLVINSPWGESMQHFMLDVLPLATMGAELVKRYPDMYIAHHGDVAASQWLSVRGFACSHVRFARGVPCNHWQRLLALTAA
jgi:hypothetical protein